MNQEYPFADGLSRRKPRRQFSPVRMATIDINRANSRPYGNLVSLDPDGLGSVLKDASERARRLKSNEKHCTLFSPQPVFEPMTNASGLAHATRGNHDVKTLDEIECLGLLNAFGEAHEARGYRALEKVTIIQSRLWVLKISVARVANGESIMTGHSKIFFSSIR